MWSGIGGGGIVGGLLNILNCTELIEQTLGLLLWCGTGGAGWVCWAQFVNDVGAGDAGLKVGLFCPVAGICTGAKILKSLSDFCDESSPLFVASSALVVTVLTILFCVSKLVWLALEDEEVIPPPLIELTLWRGAFSLELGLFSGKLGHFRGNFGSCLQLRGSISIDLLKR